MATTRKRWNGKPREWGAYRDIPWSKYVLAARERHMRDLEKAIDPDFPYYYDDKAADKAVWFIEQLKHYDGEWKGKPFILSDWQEYDIVRPLFGWKRKSNGFRRFRSAYVEVARKNGKSQLAAAISLYLMFGDKEAGAQIYAAAALCLDTNIPTLDGWKKVKDLKIGDTLFDEKGGQCQVTYLTEVFKDHECYKLTFDDKSEIIADSGHRWKTFCFWSNQGKGGGRKATFKREGIKTTKEIFETLHYQCAGRIVNNHYIECAEAIDTPLVELPIDPYVLGVWLGDGHNDRGSFVCHPSDLEIADIIKAKGYSITQMKARESLFNGTITGIRTELRKLGVLRNKHIPLIYIRSSANQRLELLQGLMDTDGTCTKTGECRFSNCNYRIAKGVHELACSLGLKAHIRKVYLSNPNENTQPFYYIVSFKAYRDFRVFKLTRKSERQRERCVKGQSIKTKRRYITKVEKIDPVPVKCISVNSPSSLFLAGESFIPTHNTKEDQARIVWEMAGKMLQTSPFESHIEAFKSSYYNPALGSVFKPLGRDSKTQDGFSVHGAIIDEYHAHKTSALLDVLSSGRGARRQPLILVITTAGHENGGPCKAESNRMKKLLLNELESDEIFAFIATVDNEENWREETEWIKANPNWGISVYVEGFQSSFKECDQSTSKTNEFQVKNLNIWKENVSRWIKASSYDACPQVPLDLESLKGKRCFGGLDMGVTQDLSALTLAFYLKEPEKEEELPDVALLNFYWIPESSVRERWLNDGVRYPDWVADGWVRTTEGDTTRHDIIRRDINELSQMYEIAELAIDKMHAHQLMVQLEDDGLIIVKHSQSLMGMSFPAKTFEELILSKKLHVGGDPVFRWQVLNTVIITDGNGNIKPMKNKSEEKIDGVVAACMAVGRLVIAPEPQNFIYNERKGMFFG